MLRFNFGVGVNFIVGVNFVPWDNFPGGKLSLDLISPSRDNIPWDCPGSFRAPEQHLTTLDTLVGRKLSQEMSWDRNADSTGRQFLVFSTFTRYHTLLGKLTSKFSKKH